jgi:hypothetical protein
MKQLFTLLTLLLIFSTQGLSQNNEKHTDGELLIQLKNGVNSEKLINSFQNIEMVPVRQLSKRMNIWLVKYNPKIINENEVLYQVRHDENVKLVQFNHYVQEREQLNSDVKIKTDALEGIPNDPDFGLQWALNNTGQSGGTPDADIDAVEAWDLASGGPTSLGDEVVVAVIDGGCDLNHEDINYWKNLNETPGNGIDDDLNGFIDDYDGWNAYDHNGTVPSSSHGTHVAGIAGAVGNNGIGTAGVNLDVKIMPIAGSSSVESTVVEAYDYVLTMRALYNETDGLKGAFVVVTNASFGVDYGNPANFPIWCAIYDSLGMQGVLNCGATANINIDIDIQGDVPTACPSDYMIAVTNTTDTDSKNSGAAYGLTTIDLGAPGTSIYAPTPGNTYGYKTGTSMATPTVAGAVALMYAAANSNLMQDYKNDPATTALVFKQFLFDGTDPITALQGITVTGGRLNLYNAILPILAPPDTVAPTVITDLIVTDTTSNSLTLNWTAPHDTTRNGVVGYDIRFSENPIASDDDFINATQVPFGQTPSDSGETEMKIISNLSFSTDYYFAIKSFDLWNNTSAMSNAALGTTYEPPQIFIDPDSLHVSITNATTVKDTFYITNNSPGSSTLDFNISLENNTFPDNKAPIQTRILNLLSSNESHYNTKESPADNKGFSLEGSGGPDTFGYEWIDSDEPGGPAYVWNDISAAGTAATGWTATGSFDPLDEGYAGPFALGFPFKFYGEEKTEIYISSNGLLTFQAPTSNNFTNSSLPNSNPPNELICPFWDDLDGRSQGSVHYLQDGNKFIVQFTNWQKYSGTGSLTFQIVLYSSGRILFYYNNMNATLTSSTVGIENANGSDGLQIAYNASYIANGLAVKIQAEPDWLASGQTAGTLYNGNTLPVELTFNSEDFPLGDYSIDAKITSNDPVSPEITIPITMKIEAVPVELLNFEAVILTNEIQLKWSTATETNNMGFEIERKENLHWQKVGFVAGQGTTTETVNYTFKDNNFTNSTGNILYRLKQIDFDGSYNFSSAIEVELELQPKEFDLSQNYPNPFNPATTIKYAVPMQSSIKLIVYNMLGQTVDVLVNAVQETGFYNVQFNATNLASGVYIFKLEANAVDGSINFQSSKKMILTK